MTKDPRDPSVRDLQARLASARDMLERAPVNDVQAENERINAVMQAENELYDRTGKWPDLNK